MKYLTHLVRMFVGGLFIFSGLIKVNDPIGTAIKMEEYFEVFGTHFLIPIVLPVSVIFVVLEVVLGVALLLGFRSKPTIWALLGLIIFFTFLTFFSAYTGKVTDCGCFGDAIKLTPWQSFSKDVLLLALILWLIWRRNDVTPVFSEKMVFAGTAGAMVISLSLALWAIGHEPFIDFRAYSVGSNIAEKMKPSAQLKYRYLMEKDGKIEVFDNYPMTGDYTFKEMQLVNPEALAKITDYNIWSEEGDFTQESFQENKLFLVIQKADKVSKSNLDDLAKLINDLNSSPLEIWAVSSSSKDMVMPILGEMSLALPIYFADATVLKTIIRANPGLVLLQDGVVKGKWHHNDTPSAEEINRRLRP